jgi:hypothetical protein
MAESRSPITPPTSYHESLGCLGALVRLTWMAFGNGALFMLALKIAQSRRVSTLDAVFWAVVVALVALRYLDIIRLGGQTTDGEPANLRDWRRYVVCICGAAVVLWTLAHTLLRNFM